MLFCHLEPYAYNFYIFNKNTGSTFSGRANYNSEYRCKFNRFSNIPGRYGVPFDYFELQGVKFAGYLDVPYEALSEEKTPGGFSMPEMMMWHVKSKIDVPFMDWIVSNPMLRSNRDRLCLGVLQSTEGHIYLVFVFEGKVQMERIEESSTIKDGIVTTLKESMARHMASVEKALEEAKALHAKITDRSFDLPELLDRSEILNFVKWR